MSWPRPDLPAISRRAFGGTVAAAALALVAACGSSDPDGTPSASSSAAATASFPVSIEHKYGTTTLEKAPARVVVVGLTEQDALLALGVVPVATTKWFGDNPGEIWPWAKARLGGGAVPAVLDNTDGIQFEKVAAQRPDLIVGLYSSLTEEDYDTLSKIAPVIAQPKGAVDFGANWDVVTTTVAKALGKPEQGRQLVETTQKLFADTAAENPSFKGATALMATTYQGYYVYGPQDPRGRFLTSLGFSLPAGLAEVTGTGFGANLSKERTDLLDVDALVWLVTDAAKDRKTVQSDPLYAALDVRKEGRDIFLADGSTLGSATSFISVLSIPYLLQELVPQLAEAADGDPATPVVESTTTSS